MSRVYDTVLERRPEERDACLASLCEGDAALRVEVESLLAQESCGSPLDRPIWDADDGDKTFGRGDKAAGYNAGSSQQMLLAPGTRLGPYEIQSMLGAGGMGEVYRAVDTRLNRTVAIKILKTEVATDSVFRARFNREARTISQLDHPGICALFDVGEERGMAFLVMPYLDGVPLSIRLRQGPLPLSDVLKVGISLASALTYAHGHGIVHRDIKPQNVVVLPDGSVKLLDFGIAKPYGTEASTATADTEDSVTEWGQVPGTLEYMAPEQLSGREADIRSDMFSLGIVLFELASGNHPFRRATRALTMAAIVEAKYPGLPNASAGVADLDRILRKMLAAAPADRYPTMADCLADLRAIELPTGSGGLSSASVAPGRRSRHARAVAAGIAAAVVVILGVWVLSRDRSPEIPDEPANAAVTSAAAVARVTYWLDVESTADANGGRRRFESVGDDVYGAGWRFRVNVQAPTSGYLYVLGDEAPRPGNPTGLALLYAVPQNTAPRSREGATLTTDWFVFAGPPGRERLWLVWSDMPIDELASVASIVNPSRDGGVIRDANRGERIRALLTDAAQPLPTIARDGGAVRATVQTPGTAVVHRLELQHG